MFLFYLWKRWYLYFKCGRVPWFSNTASRSSKSWNKKISPWIIIKPIGNDKEIQKGGDESLALPLDLQEIVTQFEFIQNSGSENENIDTLQINYGRIDKFINRACGYRANFILEPLSAIILNSGNNWIKGFIILKDTVSDEKAAHLGILH